MGEGEMNYNHKNILFDLFIINITLLSKFKHYIFSCNLQFIWFSIPEIRNDLSFVFKVQVFNQETFGTLFFLLTINNTFLRYKFFFTLFMENIQNYFIENRLSNIFTKDKGNIKEVKSGRNRRIEIDQEGILHNHILKRTLRFGSPQLS